MLELLPVDQIEGRFRFVRDRWVLLEADLALVHGVAPERLLRCLRPFEPLPGEFCFYLEDLERRLLAVPHRRAGQTGLAFTEQGALVAGCLLGTPRAITQSVHVARLFARLRHDGVVREAPPAGDYNLRIDSPSPDRLFQRESHPLVALGTDPFSRATRTTTGADTRAGFPEITGWGEGQDGRAVGLRVPRVLRTGGRRV